MSKSYRMQKEGVIATRNMPRDRDGNLLYPRLVTRKPRRGDIHPVPAKDLRVLLHLLPLEFLYGLDRIELRPRQSAKVGNPFGCYLLGEKTVILYSLPMCFDIGWPSEDFLRRLLRCRPEVEFTEDGLKVSWPGLDRLALWFFSEVVVHELAHHFDNQYRHKNRSAGGRRCQEALAKLHTNRFYARLVKACGRSGTTAETDHNKQQET